MKKLLLCGHVFVLTLVLCSTAAAQGFKLQERWRISPGNTNYPFITSQGGANGDGGTDNLERGIAYNALSNHLLVVSRTNSQVPVRGIFILDAATGANTGPLGGNGLPTPASLDVSAVSGGTIWLIKIRVAEDGAIYAMNFGTVSATTTITIYRWSDENPITPSTIAFAGDPANGAMNLQWGYNFDIRGAGTDTQILLASTSLTATNAAVLTTTDGLTFTSTFLTATNAAPGTMAVHGSVAWGEGDTFWAKAVNNALLQLSFDTNSGTAAVIHEYSITNFPASISQIDIDVQNKWLAGLDLTPGIGRTAVTPGRPSALRLYNAANPANSPIFLSSSNMLSFTNNPFVAGSVDFGSNVVFTLSTQNGMMAFDIVPSSDPVAPYLIKQPAPQYVTAGSNATFTAYADGSGPISYQWRFNRTGASGGAGPIPGATSSVYSIPAAQPSDQGFYSVMVSNAGGSETSLEIPLFIYPESGHSILTLLWNIPPASPTWWTLDTSNFGTQLLQRNIAYNANELSDHVYVINRSSTTLASALVTINVLDSTTGADLHQLDTTGILTNGSIALLQMGVADDGAIYAANQVNTSGTGVNAIYRLYRWENSAPGTPSVAIFSGRLLPAPDTTRWGDTMHVRGSGIDTQIILDNNQGTRMAILTPTNSDLNLPWIATSVTNLYGPGVLNANGNIGRSLQFGTSNTFWQKRKHDRLLNSTYDLGNFTGTTASGYNLLPVTIGPVGIDESRNLLAGINFCPFTYAATFSTFGLGPVPDTLALYDIADPANPVPLGQYDFPTNSRPNVSFVGQVVFSGNRVYTLDANNGILAFEIVPSATPTLDIARTNGNVLITWTNLAYGYTLESTPSLSPNNWTPVGQPVVNSGGRFRVTDSASASSEFYRLRQ